MSVLAARMREAAAGVSAAAWTPLALSPAVWFDASDTASITSSSGYVSAWADKSGNAKHATTANAAGPITASHTLNGLNVIYFPNAMDEPEGMVTTASISQPCVMYLVYKNVSAPTGYVFDGAENGKRLAFGWNIVTAYWDVYDGTGFGTAYTTRDHTAQWTIVHNGASSISRKDGTQTATGDAGSQNATAGLTLGARFSRYSGIEGDIAEFIVVTGTSTVSTTCESYLKTKWGL